MKYKNLKEATEDLPNIRFNLGANLKGTLDKIIEKYSNRGVIFGMPIGTIMGSTYAYLQNNTGHYLNENSDKNIDVYFLGFLGLVAGADLGLFLGRLYSTHKISELKRQFPEKADAINKYDKISMAITARKVRTPAV
jgi:hypothetical protein